MGGKILLVDDDPTLLEMVGEILKREGMETLRAETGEEALRLARDERPAAVVLDLFLPDVAGKSLLEQLHKEHEHLPVVMLTSRGAVEDVVECMQLGAVDYLQKPFSHTRLVATVKNACQQGVLRARIQSLTKELRRGDGFKAILGTSPAVQKALDLLKHAAKSDVTLLLEGESGTGKEIAEMFGHVKGAFTGATSSRQGRFEEADGGTIFLDEIGELRPDLQVRLLRVLQEKAIQRVGGTGSQSVDVRVMAATNRNLKAEVGRGAFREDLFYRLAVFPVRLPPLRERGEDVLVLASAFLRRFATAHGKKLGGFTPEALRALQTYAWPGNIRELENAIERATILEDGSLLSLESLPDDIVLALDVVQGGGGGGGDEARERALPVSMPRSAAPPGEIVPFEEEEKRIILRALEATGWNIPEAAARLQIGRATIYRRIARYGLKLRGGDEGGAMGGVGPAEPAVGS
jgi:two-component system response regulator HydG